MNENARRSTGDITTRSEKGECPAYWRARRRARRIAHPPCMQIFAFRSANSTPFG